MPPKIHLERMMYRNSIAVPVETASNYALVKVVTAGKAAAPSLALNLALVLDMSGSMYEQDGTGVSRLQRIQQAAIAAIAKLQSDAFLAVVAFAKNAQVVLPSTRLSNKVKIEEIIAQLDKVDIDPGGTALDKGLALALSEVEKYAGKADINRIVILTDGETAAEQNCRILAQQAAQKKIALTLMGLGTEWNATLIKELAVLSKGKWYYIDVNRAEETERVFLEEFEHLAAMTFTNVQMHFRPVKDVRIKRVHQVVPEIKELIVQEVEGRHLIASLGILERDQAARYVLDLSLPKRPEGKYVLAQLEVTYTLGANQPESTGLVPLEMVYTGAGHGYINAEVAKHIDEVQIFELNNHLQQAIASHNQAEVLRLAENIASKGNSMGSRGAKKTMLAKQVLQELNGGGHVSKKTQLAVDDAARLAEEIST